MSKGTTLGMRDSYFKKLLDIFREDKNTFFVSADNGAPTMDDISDLPGQFLNVGIAEQQAVAMACGLALEGRKVWFYAIDPFVTVRVTEFIKLDMCAMNLPITALGVGSGYSYDNMGPTHHALGNIATMRPWPNLVIYSPSDNTTASALADITYESMSPQYVKFDRVTLDDIYTTDQITPSEGLAVPRNGTDVCIISTGRMVHNSLKVAQHLASQGISAGVIDLFRLKPINEALLLDHVACADKIITYEEDYLIGGLGSAIAEIIVDREIHKPVLRIGQKDIFVYDLGGREVIWKKYGLDIDSVIKKILAWL
jgi:transketolase